MASKRLPVRFRSTPRIGFTLRVSSNSRTAVFQTDNEGAIPSARSGTTIRADSPGEDRRLQNGQRGFDSLSALEGTKRITTGWSPWAL